MTGTEFLETKTGRETIVLGQNRLYCLIRVLVSVEFYGLTNFIIDFGFGYVFVVAVNRFSNAGINN